MNLVTQIREASGVEKVKLLKEFKGLSAIEKLKQIKEANTTPKPQPTEEIEQFEKELKELLDDIRVNGNSAKNINKLDDYIDRAKKYEAIDENSEVTKALSSLNNLADNVLKAIQ